MSDEKAQSAEIAALTMLRDWCGARGDRLAIFTPADADDLADRLTDLIRAQRQEAVENAAEEVYQRVEEIKARAREALELAAGLIETPGLSRDEAAEICRKLAGAQGKEKPRRLTLASHRG